MALNLGELSAIISANAEPFDEGLDEARTRFQRFGDRLAVAGAAAGAAVGAALAAGVTSALELDAATDRLSAQLGATPAEAEKYGAIAGKLYADAYGENMGEVTNAIGVVVSSFKGMQTAGEDTIKAVTANALDFANAFEIDVARAASVAGTAVNDGLAKDAKGALDLFTVALQKTPVALRENVLDATEEYGTYFRSFGFSGQEAMGIIVAAAEKGQFGIDKIGDAIKESQLLMTDIGNQGVKDAYKAIGLNAEQMSRSILKGGDASKQAFQKIVAGLQSIKDPNEQAAAALALFGTPLEDMNKEKIPEFLDAISKGAKGLGDVSGAIDKVGAGLADNAATQLESFKRKVQMVFVEKLAEAVPYIEATFGWLSRNSEWVTPLATGLGILATAIALVAGAMKVWAVVQTVMNLALWSSPITWIVLAILTLVAIVVIIATKTTWFQDIWNATWGGIKAVAGAVGVWLRDELWGVYIKGTYEGIVSGIMWVVGLFTDHLMALRKTGEKWWSWFAELPGKIKSAFVSVGEFVSAPFRAGFNAVSRFWNGTVGKLSWSVPSWVPFVGGNTISAPKLPQLAEGGVIPATPGGRLVVAGEGRETEIVSPESKLAVLLDQAVAAGRGDDGGHAEQTINVNVTLDGEVIERHTLKIMKRNPAAVASAAKAGQRSRTFAGGSNAKF
ncbi:phage tail protein [Dactylosporangium sp. NPDC000521]|uniref:phage tail protein n=1 Tax=Dactylosporangium sp. NPDC000521 TaxID=3363975 RepID=UPI0036924460